MGLLCAYCYQVLGQPKIVTLPEDAEANLSAQWNARKKPGLQHNKRSNTYGVPE